MAIIITDQFRLRQKNYLDDRQGLALSVSALKSWDYSKVPIPEGFEVYVEGVWYIYKSSHTDDPTTGKFRSREDEHHIDDHEIRIQKLEKETTQLFYEDGCDTSSTFAQILTAAFWTDSTGENHARAGRIVDVVSDSDSSKNGPWYLIASDYTKASNWVKLIGRSDLITTSGGGTPSDINLYTAAKTDALFPKKGSAENITAGWTFKANQIFEKDLTTSTLHVTTGTITTLNTTTENATNLNVSGTLKTTGAANLKEVKVGTNGSIKDESGETVARVDKVVAGTSDIGSETVGNLSAGTGNIGTLTSNTSTINNLTVPTNLKTTGGANLKEVTVGTNGSIKDEDGETVARVDKIVATSSELGDLDQQIRDRMGLIGIGNFLKNTSFAGDYESLDLISDSEVGDNTVVFNSKYDNWNVVPGASIVDDSDSVTGHSMRLDSGTSSISQETIMSLNKGASYIISWKQKGTIRVEVGSYTLDVKTILTTTNYKFCYAQIIPTETRKELVVFYGGPGNVLEIKFEEGVIPTSWFPSVLDTDPLADELYRFEYLRASFLDHPEGTDLTTSNVFLKSQIKLGDIVNNEVTDVYGGISGVVSDGKDVMIWSGSSYEKATELLTRIENNEFYLDNLTPEQLKDLTKSIITFNYKSIFTDVYAVGKFKGKHLGEDGEEFCSYPRLTGFLPSNSGKIGFTGGRLNKVGGSYPTSINFGGTTINFNAGLCTNPEGQYTIGTGSEIAGITELHLIFHEGFLTKISSVKDYNTTYYWY